MEWSDLSYWYTWYPELIILYAVLGLIAWVVCLKIKDKIKHPELVGAAVSLSGGFDVGLFAFVSLSLFLMLQWGLSRLMKDKDFLNEDLK
jgi:hypothetical protein